MPSRRTSWWIAQLAGGGFVAALPVFLAGANPWRALPSLAGGLDPLLQCGILQWVLRHPPLHAAAWQAPFFAPAPWSLAYMDSLFGQSLLVTLLPGMRAWPALAYNLCLAGTLLLAFLFTVRLGRELGLRRWAAWLAAFVYTAGPYAAGHYHHLNQLPTPWLPLALWGLARTARGKSDGLLWLALALGLQPLWGVYNLASLWMCLLVVLFFALPDLRGLKGLVLALVMAGGLLWAWQSGAPYRQAAEVVAGFVRASGSVGPFAGRPFDLLHPPAAHLLSWPAALPGRPVLYAGLLWPFVALVGFVFTLKDAPGALRRRLWWAMALGAGLGLVLAFGRRMPLPLLGETKLPLGWLQDRFWALQALRAPTRLFLPGMLFLALAGAAGCTRLLSYLARRPRRGLRWAGRLLVVLALLDLMPGRIDKVRAQPDREERALLTALARDRAGGAWMTFPVPCSERDETLLDARCMLWSAMIDRPVAGGSSGFVPMRIRRLRRSCCRGYDRFCLDELRRNGVSEIVLPKTNPPVDRSALESVWRGTRWELWRLVRPSEEGGS